MRLSYREFTIGIGIVVAIVLLIMTYATSNATASTIFPSFNLPSPINQAKAVLSF